MEVAWVWVQEPACLALYLKTYIHTEVTEVTIKPYIHTSTV